MNHDSKNNLASGMVTITSTPHNIKIPYLEYPSRNGILHPIVDDLDLNEQQTAKLEEKIKAEELKLKQGRARYAQIALQETIFEEELNHETS